MHNKFYALMKQLSKPSKVASTLDWKKFNGSTLLSLNIHKNRIGVAVASHPSFGEKCQELEPLRFADDHMTIDKNCLDRFQRIVDEYKVCGLVVSWPLQRDTGRMGAACGRVLYALEELIDKSGEHSMASAKRPLCLWDSDHIIPKQRADPKLQVDGFGRCASYGNTSGEKEYIASKSQYHEDENTVVVRVWEDFCKEHWPDLYHKAAIQDNEGEAATKPSLVSRTRTRAVYGT
jgi:hypothetical protein